MSVEKVVIEMRECLQDPMWPNHVELHKLTIKKWLKVILDMQRELNLADEMAAKVSELEDAMEFIRPHNFKSVDAWVQHILEAARKYSRQCLGRVL